MASIVPISVSVGANRIIPTVAIPYPLGNPALSPAEEKVLRRKLVERALQALSTDVDGQTVFEETK
jgi:betaine reductase